ncbi:MAG: hypothetical protein QM783_10415 [Phycisphaerales bacterium]
MEAEAEPLGGGAGLGGVFGGGGGCGRVALGVGERVGEEEHERVDRLESVTLGLLGFGREEGGEVFWCCWRCGGLHVVASPF